MSEKKKKMKVPAGALRFTAPDSLAFAEVSKGEDGEKHLKMTPYSGKIIKNHFWWGDTVLDVEGIQFDNKTKFPVLEEHRNDKKIAVSSRPLVTEQFSLELDPAKTKFVSTPESEQFQKLSLDDGFPYQASIHFDPMVIERIEDGASVKVNGYKFKGPGTVFRKWVFKEASVCVFGFDTKSQATAFSKEEVELELEEETILAQENTKLSKEEVKTVEIKTVEELTGAHPELVKSIQEAMKTDLETTFSKERATFKTELAKKDTELDGQNDRILKLEKTDTIRSEKELATSAGTIWATKLSNSDIPEHLYDKVAGMVSHTKFVKEGVLDKEVFGIAVDEEIADWVKKGVVSTVMGTGFSANSDESGETLVDKQKDEDTTKMANHLLVLAGQKLKEEKAA